MPEKPPHKRSSTALALILLVAVIALFFALRPDRQPAAPSPPLADLGVVPDWPALAGYDHTITKEELETLLREVFAIDDTWRDYITVDDGIATIRTSSLDPQKTQSVKLASNGNRATPSRYWRPAADLPPAFAEKPLDGIHIALDAGHIGGAYAQIEERWFQIGEGKPVIEGEMSLQVAKLVKPQLEELGATVTLVRESTAPLTVLRNEDFLLLAREKLRTGTQEEIRSLSERLFYRTAEIRERARVVNDTIKPDLVVCIHFNAEPWGDPSDPQLTEANHCHLLLNGAYTPGEIAHDDERFEMLLKLLQGTHAEERALATSTAAAFAKVTGLPAYRYNPDSSRALKVEGHPYLWARNLLANRLYRCPVLFLEPYVMNSHDAYARIQEGNYEGSRVVAGKEQPSIFREYAQAITTGLADYYGGRVPVVSNQ